MFLIFEGTKFRFFERVKSLLHVTIFTNGALNGGLVAQLNDDSVNTFRYEVEQGKR